MNRTPCDIGAANELTVAADLIRQGFDVFRNVSPNGPTDLVVMEHGQMLRVQVKAAVFGYDGSRTPRLNILLTENEVLAQCYADSRIRYTVPSGAVAALFQQTEANNHENCR